MNATVKLIPFNLEEKRRDKKKLFLKYKLKMKNVAKM